MGTLSSVPDAKLHSYSPAVNQLVVAAAGKVAGREGRCCQRWKGEPWCKAAAERDDQEEEDR
eukprot:1597168-Amphidinium_carterae.1